MPIDTPPTPFHCGYVAIIGEPNVGKSTLLNALLGTKLSIVTPKPQTTRKRILGFHNGPHHQIIFVDTPGLIQPKYALHESMMNAAHAAIADADALALLFDVPRSLNREQLFPNGLEEILRASRTPVLAILNKVDVLQDKHLLLPLINRFSKLYPFHSIIPISALYEDGTESVVEELVRFLPLQGPLYDPDVLSDQPQRFFVSEIIREKIFELFREEVPYATEVVIAEYKEKEDLDVIAADILVERESQRRILIGHKGNAIKEVGTRARKDIEAFLDRKIYLELHVKIRVGWRDDEQWIRRLGY